MAKHKSKWTAKDVLELQAQEFAGRYGIICDALDPNGTIKIYGATQKQKERLRDQVYARFERCLRRIQTIVPKLPPDEFAALMAGAPTWLRTMIVEDLDKMRPPS